MLKKIVSALVVLTALSGCASIVDGSTQQVTIQSTPAGAEVLINGVSQGVTPLTIDVKRADNTSLTVRKEGYTDQTITMTTKLNSTFWGNVIIGGLPGSTTDAATGASIEYAPGVHYFNLEAK
ncbi:PEGA domain-containing protein [Thalassotalea mangrovi]|uniref:PEGA domain-containing protein n=1 Tax=Thalassotalea mangrovi TaxID=2572245 RepID=A0A4U1B6Q7_9GAMM|nr:PEGA domain-containing protein [Thalassotalea mangrovi]TKB45601.1 PEGA domain-containing protein [Thalassotalea mangrovi]